jgi:hypothetical protein
MKTKNIIILPILSYTTAFATPVTIDNFGGNSINTSLWNPIAPYSDSSVSVGDGLVTLQNHGELVAKTGYSPAVEITGRFQFTGNIYDSFWITTRSSGEHNDPRFFDNGFTFTVAKQSDDLTRFNIIQIAKYDSGVGVIVDQTSYDFSLGQFYNFKITDDGKNMSFYFDNLASPLLSISDYTTFGDTIAFYNREGAGGGSSISDGSKVQIDYLRIRNVPDSLPSMISFVTILSILGLQRIVGKRATNVERAF